MKNETKIKALMKQIDSGQMKTDASRILDFIIKEGFSSMPIICDALCMPEKTVSARLSGLQDMGIIEIVTDGEPETDFQIYRYQSSPAMQVHNAYMRKKAKFNQWKKRGLQEFSEFLHQDQLELEFNL